jgi:hypothetical protein
MFTGLARRRAEEAPLFDIEKKAHWNEELLLRGILLARGGNVQFNFFMVVIRFRPDFPRSRPQIAMPSGCRLK